MRNDKIVLFAIFLFLGILSLHSSTKAQDIRIGLFENRLVNTFTIHCIKGQYNVSTPDNNVLKMQPGSLLYVTLINDLISVHDGNINYGSYTSLCFDDIYKNGEFRIKLVNPADDSRNYEGNLEAKSGNAVIQLINELPLDNYIAGVLETEAGPSSLPEYYKAQAIICRTYALKYWNKHENQFFNLCDGLHCQAYDGMNDENKQIFEAVLATHNLVMNDKNYRLINASFHANSGGETQRASDIWNGGEDYLQSVLDPFSKGQKNSEWTGKIALSDWRNYILSKMAGDTSNIPNESLLIRQEHRKKYFILKKDSILITDIRKDQGLRSTFFTMNLKGDSIVISGKGYGHGVGVSQEGAMEMARQGYSFSDILRFYYYNINISDLSDLPDIELPEPFR